MNFNSSSDQSSPQAEISKEQIREARRRRLGKGLIWTGVPVAGTGFFWAAVMPQGFSMAVAGGLLVAVGLYFRNTGWVSPPNSVTRLRFRDYLFCFAGFGMAQILFHLFVSWTLYRVLGGREPQLRYADFVFASHAGGGVWLFALLGALVGIPALLVGIILLLVDKRSNRLHS